MPITERTIKVLFAKSQNKCANPDCYSPLVIDELVLGEICHIRARRKGGPRYDSKLTEPEKNGAGNLILLCPTCHTLADKDKTGAFSVEWLEEIKKEHERGGLAELSGKEEAFALQILARFKEMSRPQKVKSEVRGDVRATADRGGVAFAMGGNNFGSVTFRTSSPKGVRGYAKNSIGADANLSGYIDYLCERYVTYMAPTKIDPAALRGRIGKNIKRRFRLMKRTRNDLPAERFWEVVAFIIDILASTPIGKKHVSNGTKFYSTFEEWRTTQKA